MEVWDVTCPKPSRDYKAENRADLGPSFAPSSGFPFLMETHKSCSIWQWATTLHPVLLTIAQKLQQAFVGLSRACSVELLLCHTCEPWGTTQATAHGQMPQPHDEVEFIFSCPSINTCTAVLATLIVLMLWRSIFVIALATALWGDQSSILHSWAWTSSLWKLWVTFTCYMLWVTPA